MLAQSQTCVQELTTELRNRCLELREANERVQDEEKLLQVRVVVDDEYNVYFTKEECVLDDVAFKYDEMAT